MFRVFLLLFLFSSFGALASELPLPPLMSSPSWIVLSGKGAVIGGASYLEAKPIASITKMAMAMAYLDARPSLDEIEVISAEDVDVLKHTSSRLAVGAAIPRRELLRLALASSENRAASALARGFRGGSLGMVAAMNAKASAMGWRSARFVDPTGLSPENVASAKDVAMMARAAKKYPEILAAAKSSSFIQKVEGPGIKARAVEYKNTNKPLRLGQVSAVVSKTGYINEAGRCLAWALGDSEGGFAMAILGAPSFASRDRDEVVLDAWARGKPPPPIAKTPADAKGKLGRKGKLGAVNARSEKQKRTLAAGSGKVREKRRSHAHH